MENAFEHRQHIRFLLMVPFWPGVAAVARCTLSKQEIQFIFIPNGYRQDLCVHNSCGYLKQTNTFLSLPPVAQFSLLNTHLLISLLTTGISHTSVLLHLINKRKRKKSCASLLNMAVWTKSAGEGMKPCRPVGIGAT